MEPTDEVVRDRRERWVFRYKPAEVLAAAKKGVRHHIERREWWEREGALAEAQLKKKGFEYRERRTSYENQVQIVGDPELAQRVAECRQKVGEHREKQKLYETWARALKAKNEREGAEDLELAISDIVFFGL
jgi:hypothetical protein